MISQSVHNLFTIFSHKVYRVRSIVARLRYDCGSANTADHPFLARRFVASGCLETRKPEANIANTCRRTR